MTINLPFYALYTEDGVGKTGLLDVTIDIDKVSRADGTKTVVATGVATVEHRNGIYFYLLTGVADFDTHDYEGCFKTADATVDSKYAYSYWGPFGLSPYSAQMALIDAAISTRLAEASYTAPLTDAETAAAILDALGADYNEALTVGAFINLLPTIAAAVSGLVNVTVVNPAAASGDVTTIQGDTYLATHGREISWKGYGIWPDDLSGATVTAIIDGEIEIDCTIVTPSGEDQEVICEPTGAETASISAGQRQQGKHLFQVKAVMPGQTDPITLVNGWWTSLKLAVAPVSV